MELIFNLIVVLHFIGLASLLGGWLVQMASPEKGVNRAMFDGAITQVVTGVLMVGIVESGALDDELNMNKISVKLLVALAVLVLTIIGRKKPLPQTGLWAAIGALTLVNVFVAVLWG